MTDSITRTTPGAVGTSHVRLEGQEKVTGAARYAADVPFEVLDDTTDGAAVTVDEPLRTTLDGFTFDVIHPVELEAGDEVEITVRGGTSDDADARAFWVPLLAVAASRL